MSSTSTTPVQAAAQFADGRPVLVGDDRDSTIFVAAAADQIDADRLSQLQELGGGMTVLGLKDTIARRLELVPVLDARRAPDLRLTAPVDAATGITGGWSLRDRARTMRLVAHAETGPSDLSIPGHVHAARLGEDVADAADAAIVLARLAERPAAVALCAVVDPNGVPIGLTQARNRPALTRLALAETAHLRSLAVALRADAHAVSCALPTRDGAFRAIGYEASAGESATVALLHGDPSMREDPLVHVHVACLLGDAFGSLLCGCRRELESATAAIVAEAAGVIIYASPTGSVNEICGSRQGVDASLVAGLLRMAGVERLRLSAASHLRAHELETCGLAVVR